MRAVVQGIDLRASWDRYLRTEGEHEDLRKVRSTIARMRSEFAAAARRHARAGNGAADPGRGRRGPGSAGAAEPGGVRGGARARGLLGGRAAGGVRRGVRSGDRRRTKVAARAPDPPPARGAAVARAAGRAGSRSGGWRRAPGSRRRSPTRLEKAKLRTLADLVDRINGVGARWWTSVPGVGELKAARILDWLRLYEPSIGMPHRQPRRGAAQSAAAGAARQGRRQGDGDRAVREVPAAGRARRQRRPLPGAAAPVPARGEERLRGDRRLAGDEARSERHRARRRRTAPIGRKPSDCCSGRSSSTASRSRR